MTDEESTAGTTAWQQRGSSFGDGVDAYETTRPGYPVESVRWILGAEPKDVLDLGAGTGLLTRVLAAEGHRTRAVEPDAAMRARITATAPGAEALAGSAEDIPLPDACLDAVLVSHAYHWFDPAPAHAEIARVLRPGGVLATLWNLRDEEVPWSAALSGILADEDTGTDPRTPAAIMLHGALKALRAQDSAWLTGWLRDPSFGPEFGAVEQGFFPHSEAKTIDSLVTLIKSRSYYLTYTTDRRRELDDRIRELAPLHPEL
ncbi:class I SAM-dependent methyltransferase, partial [Streptomyces anulatus]|uniref:class I SAM-dependent methyltransferase n=1 Tax=Streptomyces anulatus TaxID=1892 RepID=UPI0036564C69